MAEASESDAQICQNAERIASAAIWPVKIMPSRAVNLLVISRGFCGCSTLAGIMTRRNSPTVAIRRLHQPLRPPQGCRRGDWCNRDVAQ